MCWNTVVLDLPSPKMNYWNWHSKTKQKQTSFIKQNLIKMGLKQHLAIFRSHPNHFYNHFFSFKFHYFHNFKFCSKQNKKGMTCIAAFLNYHQNKPVSCKSKTSCCFMIIWSALSILNHEWWLKLTKLSVTAGIKERKILSSKITFICELKLSVIEHL